AITILRMCIGAGACRCIVLGPRPTAWVQFIGLTPALTASAAPHMDRTAPPARPRGTTQRPEGMAAPQPRKDTTEGAQPGPLTIPGPERAVQLYRATILTGSGEDRPQSAATSGSSQGT